MTDWLAQKPPPARTRPSGSEVGAAASPGGAVHDNGSRIRTRTEFRAFTDRADPARYGVESDCRFEVDHGAGAAEIEAAGRAAGDRNGFNGATTVEAAREGSLVFSRTRRCSAPRGFL